MEQTVSHLKNPFNNMDLMQVVFAKRISLISEPPTYYFCTS